MASSYDLGEVLARKYMQSGTEFEQAGCTGLLQQYCFSMSWWIFPCVRPELRRRARQGASKRLLAVTGVSGLSKVCEEAFQSSPRLKTFFSEKKAVQSTDDSWFTEPEPEISTKRERRWIRRKTFPREHSVTQRDFLLDRRSRSINGTVLTPRDDDSQSEKSDNDSRCSTPRGSIQLTPSTEDFNSFIFGS